MIKVILTEKQIDVISDLVGERLQRMIDDGIDKYNKEEFTILKQLARKI